MSETIIPPYCPPKPWLDKAPWHPVDAPLKGSHPRSRANYRAVIEQFEVTSAKRYARTIEDTWCNIFAWDVTRAMGCEIPHWVDPATGSPVGMGKGKELRVDGIFKWLTESGELYGWRPCLRFEAELAAEQGCPTVVLDTDDHIAMVVSVAGSTGIRVTQAGAHNFVDGTFEQAWPAKTIPTLKYFTHA